MKNRLAACGLALAFALSACGGGEDAGRPAGEAASEGEGNIEGRFRGRILFESNDPLDAVTVRSINLRNGRIATEAAGRSPNSWDGSEFVFLEKCAPLSSRVSVVDEDGFVNPVTDCREDESIGDGELLSPVISRDGARIAVSDNGIPDPTVEHVIIVVRKIIGTHVFDRGGEMLESYSYYGPATWTRRGDLVMAGTGGQAGFGIFSVGSELGEPERIDDGRISSAISAIDAHPSENKVVFVYNRQIWEMDLSDGRPRRLHAHGYPIVHASYGPNGDAVAFVTADPLDEALATPGGGYDFFIYEDGDVHSVNVPFIPGGPLSWVE